MLALAIVPALPRPLFIMLGVCAFAGGQLAHRRNRFAAAQTQQERDTRKRMAIRRPEMALGLVGVDAVSIELGNNLLQLLVAPIDDALLDRIGEVRRALAAEIGIVLPGVRLRDDPQRDPDGYAIRIRDELAGEGTLDPARMIAVADEPVLARISGESTREPVYGLAAKWIAPNQRDAALREGALVFDAISILGSHLAETARANAGALLGRQEFHTLLEHLRASVPSLVKEIGTEALPFGIAHKAVTLLLRERVWPRDPVAAFEAMVEACGQSRDARDLAEAARRVLVPAQLRRRGVEVLEPLLLEPQVERQLAQAFGAGEGAVDPQLAMAVRERAEQYALSVASNRAALLCTSALRPALADFLARSGVRLNVYSYAEVPPEILLQPAQVVRSIEGAAAA